MNSNIKPNIESNDEPNIEPNIWPNIQCKYETQILNPKFLNKTTITIIITTILMCFDTIEINLF